MFIICICRLNITRRHIVTFMEKMEPISDFSSILSQPWHSQASLYTLLSLSGQVIWSTITPNATLTNPWICRAYPWILTLTLKGILHVSFSTRRPRFLLCKDLMQHLGSRSQDTTCQYGKYLKWYLQRTHVWHHMPILAIAHVIPDPLGIIILIPIFPLFLKLT